jgi:alpha-ketoglutarate-dependent taurine dioxygenase
LRGFFFSGASKHRGRLLEKVSQTREQDYGTAIQYVDYQHPNTGLKPLLLTRNAGKKE